LDQTLSHLLNGQWVPFNQKSLFAIKRVKEKIISTRKEESKKRESRVQVNSTRNTLLSTLFYFPIF
jgi:hypothetical protein